MNGLDMLVGVKVCHSCGTLTFEGGVELAHLGQVYPITFSHFVCHGFGNGGDDGLVLASPECRTVEHDIVQQFVQR